MGGTSGIGLATANAARALGAEVIVTGRDEQKLRSAVAELGGGAGGVRVDAVERDQLERFFGEIGRIDHLVLALSRSAGGGPIASLDLADLRAGFEGKFWPHLAALQVALPSIQPAGSSAQAARALRTPALRDSRRSTAHSRRWSRRSRSS
jgi:NAD(P)-dependent dehydrogenase (short-subunit alcohol dehydrogenase family)